MVYEVYNIDDEMIGKIADQDGKLVLTSDDKELKEFWGGLSREDLKVMEVVDFKGGFGITSKSPKGEEELEEALDEAFLEADYYVIGMEA